MFRGLRMATVEVPVIEKSKSIDFLLGPDEGGKFNRVIPLANSVDPREVDTIREVLGILARHLKPGYYTATNEHMVWEIKPRATQYQPQPSYPSH